MLLRNVVLCVLVAGSALALTHPAHADCDPHMTNRTPTERYVVSGGEVYDKVSNLTWQRCSVGQRWQDGAGCVGAITQLTWGQAMGQAGGGWRVPTKAELATLQSPTCNPHINQDVFPDMAPDKLVYWTSTKDQASTAWYIVFGTGSIATDSFLTYYGYRSDVLPVRLVRSRPAH